MQTDAIHRTEAISITGLSMPLDMLRKIEQHPNPASMAAVIEEGSAAGTGRPPSANGLLHAVTALISAVNCALSGESQHARQYLSAACHSLEPDSGCSDVESIVECGPSRDRCRGGLAPWQIRCVSTHIEGHLSETIQCEDLSNLVNLSLSHFMRAFRDSFGCPPHAYLMRRRMERAQGLMLTTDTALGEIALECGLADQSHLSRLFQRFVGESPAAWRRARAPAARAHR
jgi:AraC-like DNA-binding protein